MRGSVRRRRTSKSSSPRFAPISPSAGAAAAFAPPPAWRPSARPLSRWTAAPSGHRERQDPHRRPDSPAARCPAGAPARGDRHGAREAARSDARGRSDAGPAGRQNSLRPKLARVQRWCPSENATVSWSLPTLRSRGRRPARPALRVADGEEAYAREPEWPRPSRRIQVLGARRHQGGSSDSTPGYSREHILEHTP